MFEEEYQELVDAPSIPGRAKTVRGEKIMKLAKDKCCPNFETVESLLPRNRSL